MARQDAEAAYLRLVVSTARTLDERFDDFLLSIVDLTAFLEPDDEWPLIVIFDRSTAPPLPLQFARPSSDDEIAGLGALLAVMARSERADATLLLVPATTDDGEEVIVASARDSSECRVAIARVERMPAASPTLGRWLKPREFGAGHWFVAQFFRLAVALDGSSPN